MVRFLLSLRIVAVHGFLIPRVVVRFHQGQPKKISEMRE